MDDTAPAPRWHTEEVVPELDLPPEGHHDQPDTDPPDLPPVQQ
jgi:hypothetical protein